MSVRSTILGGTLTACLAIGATSGAYAQTVPVPAPEPSIIVTTPPAARTVVPHYRNIRPFYRNIRAFWGEVNPFYRNIRAFWGDVDPFYRNIRAFWGDIDPIVQSKALGAPDYTKIGAFWEDMGSKWTGIHASWEVAGAYRGNESNYATFAKDIDEIIKKSEELFGKTVQARTGKSFRDGFANGILARYGINLARPETLAGLPAGEQSHFFVDYYDGLMEYSGTDHADHWMRTVNWTPALTQSQGEGKDAVIGLLDFVIAGDTDIRNKVVAYDGVSNFTNGHGAAVASLLVASHDGKGVMGIAPGASVVAFNPFDETGTASWEDVTRGVAALSQTASIVNMSLGTPGWTLESDWKTVFQHPTVAPNVKNVIYVKAAGNEGVSQTTNVEWDWTNDPALVLVGSVDPSGVISTFSNRPGEACLLSTTNTCSEANKLKHRFLVAPGELILVSNDQGGITRESGTSIAAPIVSGAIALIHDRWPWLADKPKATLDILFGTAKDLGAPGVDAVYGRGLLDIEAAQSPKSFDNLTFYEKATLGKTAAKTGLVQRSAELIQESGVRSSWESAGVYFYAFERLDPTTQRDFAIPLSTKLVNQTLALNGTQEEFQTYLYDRLLDWINSGDDDFTDVPSFTAPVGKAFGFDVSMAAARSNPARLREGGPAFQSALRFGGGEGSPLALSVGYGDGAVALGQRGFKLTSSYDPGTGGANPLLGFASGGGYASAELAVAPGLTLKGGATQRRIDGRKLQTLVGSEVARAGVEAYEATAQQIGIDYDVNDALRVSLAYTGLNEKSALLGVQSVDRSLFRGGSHTDGVTLGLNVDLPASIALSAAATAGRTRQGSTETQTLAVGEGGILTTAFEVGLTKNKVFGKNDRIRFGLSQPMYVEDGSFDYSVVKVVDRNTGEIGEVTEHVELASSLKRALIGEMIYATPILGGTGELSAFGRVKAVGDTLDPADGGYSVGGRLRIAF